jgi:hypothetical protein
VDLGEDVPVSSVKIYNSDVPPRLSNSVVSLKDNQGSTVKSYHIGDATGKAMFEFKNSFEFAGTSFTGPHTNKFLASYTSGTYLYTSTSETLAKDACKARDDCKGVTQEPFYTLRTGLTLNDSPSGEVSWLKSGTSFTGPHTNKFLAGYTSGTYVYNTEALAKDACNVRTDCNGVTTELSGPIYTLRTGLTLNDSPSGEVSWLKREMGLGLGFITSFTGPHTNKFLAGYTSGTYVYNTEALAKAACKVRTDCNGVTTELSGRYTLRTGLTLSDSGSGEVSWQKTIDLKCDELLQQFHRFDEELSVQGKWQGGSVTGVCKGWGTDKVGLGFSFSQHILMQSLNGMPHNIVFAI